MRIQRVQHYLAQARVPVEGSGGGTSTHLIEEVLASCGIAGDQMSGLDEAFRLWVPGAAAVAFGTGYYAWALADSGAFIDRAIDVGADLGGFVLSNLDTMMSDWPQFVHLLDDRILEMVLHLPASTIHIGHLIAEYLTQPHSFHVVSALSDGFDAVDVAVAAVTFADILEAITTLGLSLAIGAAAVAAIRARWEPRIEAKKAELERWKVAHEHRAKLRHMLTLGLPPRMVAVQLARVDRQHWSF